MRRLASEDCDTLTVGREALDLRDQQATFAWMSTHKPDAVILAAAKVGGILANRDHPAEFIHDNLAIQANVIEGARRAGVGKLLFLGSSCIYPAQAVQPIGEDSLLTGPLEPTNEAYAVAKIAGIKMCQAYRAQHGCDFISAMPCNLYGPGDTFDTLRSHVIPALILKAHAAKRNGERHIEIWGTGNPRREFLYAEDAADGLVFLLRHYSGVPPVNIGAGGDVSIGELAGHILAAVGHDAEIRYDPSKPDGVAAKLMDSRRIFTMGWRPSTALPLGLAKTYKWYRENLASL